MIRYNRYKLNLSLKQRIDPGVMPVTGETPEERLKNSLPLFDTAGQQYVESRGIPAAIAHDAGVRFDPDWDGRAAVIVPMYGANHEPCSVHGRYLQQAGSQNKMLTIGPGGGVLTMCDGLNKDIIIIVEGLFDALSLAVCGYGSVATVGRKAPWLPEHCKGKTILLAFDGNRPGETTAMLYKQLLVGANTQRLSPPGTSKDWNTALIKRGRPIVEQWLKYNLARFTKKQVHHEQA
jgi:hypothetical protein